MHIGACNSSKSVSYSEFRMLMNLITDLVIRHTQPLIRTKHVLPSISINQSRRMSEIFSRFL